MRGSLILALLAVTGCKTTAKDSCQPAPRAEGQSCAPGNYVYCRCEDLREGTKQCGCDGNSYVGECKCTGAPATSEQNVTTEDPDPPVTRPGGATSVKPPPSATGPSNVASPASEANSCPGLSVAIDADYTTLIEGDTSESVANYAPASGACAVATGKEQIFEMIPTATGKLNVVMHGAGILDPTLYVREADCESGAQRACAETTGVAADETARFNVVTGRKYYVFADSKANTSGAYTLEVWVEPGSFCGDGKVNDNEACDDGNNTPGDGCGANCRIDGDSGTFASCPGQAVHIWKGNEWTITESTSGLSNQSASDMCQTSAGPDRIYAVTVHGHGTLNVRLTTVWDGVVYIRRNACAGLETTCADDYDAGAEAVGFGVTEGTYWVVVDGAAATDKGTFELKLSLQ